MDKTIDVVGLGDLMIDFTYSGVNEDGTYNYTRNPAGSMGNVLAQVTKLGGRAVLVSTLGFDEHSKYLYETAEKLGIDMSCVRFGTWPTRFMFAYFGEGNDRKFSDYRSPRNEAQTELKNVDLDKLRKSKFLDIKAIVFSPEDPIIETQNEMMRIAEENGVIPAIDMQWRGLPIPEEDKKILVERAKLCGVVKVTNEELLYFFPASDIESAVEKVFEESRTQILAVTMGACGCLLCTRTKQIYCPTYDVPVKDTTGAGDSFMGALLFTLSRHDKPIYSLTTSELEEIGDYCNACASFSTTKKGSLLGMASQEDADLVRKNWPKLVPEVIPALLQRISE